MEKFELDLDKIRTDKKAMFFYLDYTEKLKIDSMSKKYKISRGEIVRQMVKHCLKDLAENE